MAANMQQMAGGQLMQQQQRFGMGGAQGMDFSRIAFQYIQSTPYVGPGWQANVPIAERVGKAQDLITSAVLATPQPNWQRIAQVCLQFEQETFRNSANKGEYDSKMRQKSAEMQARRQGHVPQLQETMNAQAAQQQMMMMNQQRQSALMQAQMAGRGVGPGQQGFHHLQNPMQVSPLPQQAAQMGLSLSNGMTPQASPGQPGFSMPGGPQRVPDQSQLSDLDKQRAHQMALQMLQTMGDAQKQQMMSSLAARLPPQRLTAMRAEGADILLVFLQQKNANQILQARQAHMQQQQQQQSQQQQQQQQPPGMPPNTQGMPMQPGQQRPMNPVMMNNIGQPGGQMGPFGNMESIVNEQKQGFMAEQAGQLVVPASSGQGRNATPQPLAGMQPQNTFPQGPNQAPRPQMPHGLDPQQQERFRQQMQASHAHAQAQAQLRAQAAAKGLQGQPGGLSGPMPASQSPGMDTLNAPVRQPPVAMGQMGANPAAAGNPQFGQGLDPRFNQPGAPGPMHGNPNGPLDPNLRAMFAQLSSEQQQRFRQLPPDKLNDILMKLKQGTMQGRTGQPQPGMPMNPGNPANPMGMPMQQGNGGMNPQMQQIMQQQQLNRMRAASNPLQHPQAQMIMENMDVPLQVSQRIPGIPPNVKKWHQFKAWIQQTNTNIPDQMKQSLKTIQAQQYRRLMTAQAPGGNMGPVPGGPQQAGAPRPNSLANLPPNVQLPQVTAQEVHAFRMAHDKFREAPDEQIRVIIQRIKFQRMQSQQGPGSQAVGAPQPPVQTAAPATTQSGAPPSATGGPQGFPQGHPIPAPAPAPEPAQNPSVVAPGPKASRPPQQNMPAPPNPSPAAAPKSLKRPSSDDLEATTQQNANSQRPQSQPGQISIARPIPILTPEQIAKMPPLQRQRYEVAIRQQQHQGQQDVMLFRAIYQEEKQAFEAQKFPDLPLTADNKAQIMPVISKAIEDFNKISKILRQWFGRTRDDGRLRAFIKARLRLVSQFQDGEQAQNLKDKLTMTMSEVLQSRQLIESMVKDLSASNTGRPPQVGGASADQEPSQQNQPGPKQAPTPLNEANLAKQTQALNKMHQRSNSRGGQPPAAPTSAQPPFPFGATSPDGKPIWAAPTPLTQDNLQIPATRKRVKTTNQTSSPVVSSQHASPQPKIMSPELKRQEPKAAPSKPAFMCMEPGCELAGSGFPTEDARKQHHQEVHVLPYQNPQQFLEQSVAAAFGLDEHGLSKTQPKPEAATPMSRETSVRGQGSAPAGPVTQAVNTDDKMAAGSKPADKNTPGQATTLPQQSQMAADPLANTTIDPQSLMAPVLHLFDASAGGVISDMSLYRSTTPNEDTPNSSASKESGVSEPNSDIPETANLEIDMNWANYDGSTLVNGMAAFGMDMDLNSFGAMADDDMHITEDMLVDMDKPFTSLDSSLYGLEAL